MLIPANAPKKMRLNEIEKIALMMDESAELNKRLEQRQLEEIDNQIEEDERQMDSELSSLADDELTEF